MVLFGESEELTRLKQERTKLEAEVHRAVAAHSHLAHERDVALGRVRHVEDENAQLKSETAQLQGENAQLHGTNVQLHADMEALRKELASLQRVAEENEARICVQQPVNGKSAQGICIRWHEQGHKDALEPMFLQAAKSSDLPGDMVFDWSASSKYAVALFVIYPATNRLDESVVAAIRQCQAAAPRVVLVALRWGQNAPELNLSKLRDSGVSVVNIHWDKDAADEKFLVHCPQNDKGVKKLRGILRAAVPERPFSLSASLGRLAGSWR